MSGRTRAWIALLLSLAIVGGAGWALEVHGWFSFLALWIALYVPIFIATPGSPSLFEGGTSGLVVVILWACGVAEPMALGLPIVSTSLAWVVFGTRSRWAFLLGVAATSGWIALLPPGDWTPLHAVLIALALLGWPVVWIHLLSSRTAGPVERVDVLLASYSGNTAHLTAKFVAGAADAGAEVTVHRMHYVDGPAPRLEGDALALSFPVFGWKPPWPVFDYLLKGLPPGKGRPAFLLYSSAGGPENAGIVAWLALTVRGYRVVGRGWGVYPISVATFRLGPKFFWRWMDGLLPMGWESGDIRALGRSFVRGEATGLPFVLWPSPLPIVGFLADNRWVNRFLYRNHAFKNRCDGCGICVGLCPAGRLKLVDKRPVATGTCTLCLGCINHCPTGAMQMWFLSEYGHPYWTKFPEYIVRTRRRAEGLTPGRKGSGERRRSMDDTEESPAS